MWRPPAGGVWRISGWTISTFISYISPSGLSSLVSNMTVMFCSSLKYVPFDVRYPPEWLHDPKAEKPSLEFEAVSVRDTWAAMENLLDKGLVRNIGLSNWNCQGLRDIFTYARIKPAVLQIEVHPYLQCERLVSYAQSLGLLVTAYSPLGHGQSYSMLGYSNNVAIKEAVVLDIARNHSVTPAQVVLRWAVQRGCSVIPKSENLERIRENIALDFALTEDDMEKMKSLERGLRMNDPGYYCHKFFNTECPIWD